MEGELPNLPPDEMDPDFREIDDEPDSEENALRDIELPEVEETPSYEALNIPENLITKGVADTLCQYGWHDISNITASELFDLCEDLEIEPEILRMTIAVEDLGFWIEKKNFDARALSRAVSFKEIVDEGKSQDLESRQTEETDLAILNLNGLINDPIVQKQALLDRRVEALKELDLARSSRAKTFDEYTERQARIAAYTRELKYAEDEIDQLLGIETVNMRRDRALRRMAWLLEQDFLVGPIAEFKAHFAGKGSQPTFHELAEVVAGKYRDAFSVKPKGEQDDAVGETRTPGIIDKLLEEQALRMSTQTGKTDNDRENEALMMRRLLQAKALCENVFSIDLEDGIYKWSPISESEYNLLHFVNRRLFMHSDKEILGQFVSFLPGSNLRDVDGGEMEEVPLTRFSGRSLNDLFNEVDRIIERHPTLDHQKIEALVTVAEQGEISQEDFMILLGDAYRVLERLVYKEKHSVGQLISPE